jgi:hypothetical protein
MPFGIDLHDEYLHTSTNEPHWRESLWLDAYDISQDIGILVYMHCRPGQGKGDVVACVIDARRESRRIESWNMPYDDMLIGKSKTGLSLANVGFHVVHPGSTVQVTADSPELGFDLTFDGYGPVFDYDWVKWTHSHHYEQFGSVNGTVRVGKRLVAFAGSGTRDHAWGARASVKWQGWVWITARFPSRSAWSICVMQEERNHLLAYLLDGTAVEVDQAVADVQWKGSEVAAATLSGSAGGQMMKARIHPIASIDLSGKDQTKQGIYQYYFVEVEDVVRGHGIGLFDVFSPTGYPDHFAA